MLERLASCVIQREPVLLVGETGCGKTAMIQALARKVGASLVVHNLSVQSDSSELLGGYRALLFCFRLSFFILSVYILFMSMCSFFLFLRSRRHEAARLDSPSTF